MYKQEIICTTGNSNQLSKEYQSSRRKQIFPPNKQSFFLGSSFQGENTVQIGERKNMASLDRVVETLKIVVQYRVLTHDLKSK